MSKKAVQSTCWSCNSRPASDKHELSAVLTLTPAGGSEAARKTRDVPIPTCRDCAEAFAKKRKRGLAGEFGGFCGLPLMVAFALAVSIIATSPKGRALFTTVTGALTGIMAALFLTFLLSFVVFGILLIFRKLAYREPKLASYEERKLAPYQTVFVEFAEIKQAIADGWKVYNVCFTQELKDEDARQATSASETAEEEVMIEAEDEAKLP